ncbi:uncharacterized protein LOC114363927 isoform X6 [Ostrinia furnacalis]|uniref:uncharacterized protein LOC114363927 isoform X6 n=1 Tax=Ostrinia furnacalis TaxID=93504 RepID=UPI00103F2DD2|nr:uncharacterized protein LOC114363927 isoform X6 [Ostrinia furnacalis]
MRALCLQIGLRTWDVKFTLSLITAEIHQSNGQVERYCRTVMIMIRVETSFYHKSWSKIIWKLQLNLNITVQRSTRCSPLNLLIGSNGVTPVIRSVVRDIAMDAASPNRESLRELARQRASELLDENRVRQDARVNERRRAPRSFQLNDLVFVRKTSQSTGKLGSDWSLDRMAKPHKPRPNTWFCGKENGPPMCVQHSSTVTMRRHMTVPLTPKAGQREVSKKSKRRSMLSHQDHATRPPSQRHQTLMMLRSRTTRCQERPC